MLGFKPDEFVMWPGGVPIYKDDTLLGAAGVSNLTGDEDEAIAAEAVEIVGYKSSRD